MKILSAAALLSFALTAFGQSTAPTPASGSSTPATPSAAQSTATPPSAQSATATPPPIANHATDAEIRKMFEAMHMRENNQKFLQGMMPYLEREARQQAAGFASMDDSDKAFFRQTEEEEMHKMTDPQFVDSLIETSIPFYAERLTPEDVQAITAFYTSPAGKHLQEQLPIISKGAMQADMPLIQKRAQEITEDQRKKLSDYMTKKYGTTAPKPSLLAPNESGPSSKPQGSTPTQTPPK